MGTLIVFLWLIAGGACVLSFGMADLEVTRRKYDSERTYNER